MELLPQLPRSPQNRDTRTRWKPPLASPPGGPEGVVLRAPGYGRDVIRGGTSDWNRMLYSNPPVTGGQNTHTVDCCFVVVHRSRRVVRRPIFLSLGIVCRSRCSSAARTRRIVGPRRLRTFTAAARPPPFPAQCCRPSAARVTILPPPPPPSSFLKLIVV